MPMHVNFSFILILIHYCDRSLMFFQKLSSLVFSHIADCFIWFIFEIFWFFQLKLIVIFDKIKFFIQLILADGFNFINNFRLILRGSQFILCIFHPFSHQYIDFFQPFLHIFKPICFISNILQILLSLI